MAAIQKQEQPIPVWNTKKAALTNCIFCYGKVCFYFFMNSVLISLRIRSGYWTAISRNLRTFP